MEFGLDKPGDEPRWRVKQLRYVFVPPGRTRFTPGLQQSVALKGFDGTLTPPTAAFSPTEEFETEEAARALLDPQLDDWRTAVRLRTGTDILPFVFDGCELERHPPAPNGPRTLFARAESSTLLADDASIALTLAAIPEPLPFAPDALTDIGVELLNDVKVLPQHVLKFAYLLLTLFRARYQQELAFALAFDPLVLTELWELCSRGGDGVSHPSDGYHGEPLELTLDRRMWAEKVMRELTYRHGQRNAGFAHTLTFLERRPD